MISIRIKIWHKLFFSILLVVFLVLAINTIFSRLGFQHGFSQYIEEVRLKKLDKFSQHLSELYQSNGSWAFIENNDQLWRQLLFKAELAPPPRSHRRFQDNPRFKPSRSRPPRSEQQGFPPSKRHQFAPPPFLPRKVSLLNPNFESILGPPHRQRHRTFPVIVDKNIVAYLSMPSIKPIRSKLEHSFAQKQFKTLLITALVSFVIAIIATLLLTRVFNRPIARLAEMARQLTSGQFASRIQINSQDELADLAFDLNTLAETLNQNQQSRRQWIADISHELRTPLTVLRGELEAMEDGVRPLNKDAIQSLSLETKQLQRLVDDLYQLSIADQGALTYEKCSVDAIALLNTVIDGFKLSMQQKEINLSFNDNGLKSQLFADPQRLTQLFTNLLENSLRYTDEGGEIKLYCELETSLIIYIEDSAPGVPVELIPKLFDRLFRVDSSRNRESGGSGLGLSIVKSITTAHDGKITAAPSSLGGLQIKLELPFDSTR